MGPGCSREHLHSNTNEGGGIPMEDTGQMHSQLRDESLKVIMDSEHPLGPRRDGSELLLAISSDRVEKLMGPDAKKLAFDSRFDFGFENAGIERFEGPIPLDKQGEVATDARKAHENYAGFAMVFKLTRGL
jgi:hypothetical protein